MSGTIAIQEIEKKRKEIDGISKFIWENPEAGYQEFQTSEKVAAYMEHEGFQVERGAGGVPTAVRASFGTGKPVIGFIGELDALPGLSQRVDTVKHPMEGQKNGHGCGHNLLCMAHAAAAVGLKEEMIQKNLPGTVVFYGCPVEELLTGKPFMARGGAFKELDAAVNFHPSKNNAVMTGCSTAVNTMKFRFAGKASHAANAPENGRSALDAVELTNVAANYLREHVPGDVRFHYVITDGGVAPNIVPDKAEVWYYVRAFSREVVENVYERLVKIAKGAALMTETDVEVEFMGGCYNTMSNHVLSNLVLETMKELKQDDWTEEELAFAAELDRQAADVAEASCKRYGLTPETHLYNGACTLLSGNGYGSSDIGDIMHLVPTAYFYTACSNMGANVHNWQFTACAGSSIGEKGMIYAAKIMSVFGVKLLENPQYVEAAKKEFDETMQGRSYKCPIPDGVEVPEYL